ncbi:uncharacterized protein BBA_03182 [Beauveria bassiana ARSEF 2860]|uniref:Uncharacterized protein n=1 Tax=Beauveria bassiana (strain ARSEF 2860) TaxID=655819 RepID=J5K2F9_BEAB2|nr:uncharacterized protein BBA_03182 [Beauveria bassiana ARSEF 2860]EJP68286.1 hypothetical protein BBA_03182 [Beauveria bassiana ARSEF 2860]
MEDPTVAQLKVELTATENRRAVLKQEFFKVHDKLREKKAELDRLKCIHDPSPTSNKYLESLEVEGAIAELMQKSDVINEGLQEMENSIMLLRYRIDTKK